MNSTNVEPLVVKTADACRLLGCGMTRLYELMNEGAIEGFLDGGSRKIVYASLKDYVARQQERGRLRSLEKRIPKSARHSRSKLIKA